MKIFDNMHVNLMSIKYYNSYFQLNRQRTNKNLTIIKYQDI